MALAVTEQELQVETNTFRSFVIYQCLTTGGTCTPGGTR
jgi:hypothetical protein